MYLSIAVADSRLVVQNEDIISRLLESRKRSQIIYV